MKHCKNSNYSFDDSASFCPTYGSPLEVVYDNVPVPAQDPSSSVTNFFEVIKEHLISYAVQWDASDNPIIRFLPSIMSVLGLIISWHWNSIFGGAVAIGGICYGMYSKNTLNKKIAIAVGVIVVIMVILFGL